MHDICRSSPPIIFNSMCIISIPNSFSPQPPPPPPPPPPPQAYQLPLTAYHCIQSIVTTKIMDHILTSNHYRPIVSRARRGRGGGIASCQSNQPSFIPPLSITSHHGLEQNYITYLLHSKRHQSTRIPFLRAGRSKSRSFQLV